MTSIGKTIGRPAIRPALIVLLCAFIVSVSVTFITSRMGDGANIRWTHPIGTASQAAPVLSGDSIYVAANDRLVAFSAPLGEELWRYEIDERSSNTDPYASDCCVVTSLSAVTVGTVYLGLSNGRIFALDADTGTARWNRSAFPDSSVLSIAFAGETLYMTDDTGMLVAVDPATGSARWNFEAGDAIAAPPTVSDKLLFIGSYDGSFYALDRASGSERWRFETGSVVPASPVLAGNSVIASSYGGNVYAVDQETGSERWRFATHARIATSPTVSGTTLFIGNWNGDVYALDSERGTEQWHERLTTGPIASPPAVDGECIYVVSGFRSVSDWKVHVDAFDTRTGNTAWRLKKDLMYAGPGLIVTDNTVYLLALGPGLPPRQGTVYVIDPDSLYAIETTIP